MRYSEGEVFCQHARSRQHGFIHDTHCIETCRTSRILAAGHDRHAGWIRSRLLLGRRRDSLERLISGYHIVHATVHPVPIGFFESISYVVKQAEGAWLVIDAAFPDRLAGAAGVGRPDYLILTHEHLDHIVGFREPGAYADIPLVATAACVERLANPALNLSKYDPDGPPVSVRCPDILVPECGIEIEWHNNLIKLFSAPGHSPGGLLIQIDDNIFTGDTLILNHRTVTYLPGGNRAVVRKTLEWLFGCFSSDTKVWPGHGGPFLLGQMSIKDAMGGR